MIAAAASETRRPLSAVRGLLDPVRRRRTARSVAVDGIDLDLRPGEVLGLVGESGSGKSVTLRSIVRLVPPAGADFRARSSGTAATWSACPSAQLRAIRGREIAMIFQEPMTALNPVLSVRLQIDENLKAHTRLGCARAG